MSLDPAQLDEEIARKEAEIEVLRAQISAIYEQRQKTCTHPHLQVTKYAKSCPHCGYYRDRSF